MTTIKEVAKQAGVSVGVVSKAFNNYPDVSEKTRERVLKIAQEMGYSPNVVAKNLSSKKQRTIGLITSGFLKSDRKDSNNSFELFSGVYSAIGDDYELAIYLIDSEEQGKKSYAQFCKERNIGGAILMGIRTDDPYFHELMDINLPCVLVDVLVKEPHSNFIGSVTTANRRASEEMATYLLQNNHKNLIVIAGTKEAYVNEVRLEGVQAAFRKFGLKLNEDKVLYASFDEQEAYQVAKNYLTLEEATPSAFMCFSDLMAYGVMRAVKELGYQIPEDISITGFDDLIINEYIQPNLTTVRQNFKEIGRQSARLIQQLMQGEETKKVNYVEHQLMERDSVKTITNKEDVLLV